MTAVRDYRSGEAEALNRLYVASVRGLGVRHYSAAQVEVWAGLAPSSERLDALMADGRTRLVAVDGEDRPVAFADLQTDGLIHFLYCAPEAAGTGAADALYAALEARARGAGVPRLTSEASEAAVRFLKARGFTVLERRDFEVEGVAIHNYAVEKRL
ncbi:MAG TPA: GNAT family N-acetyltransferase [Brevundimonas sp.]|uniref:GNAT family N-acetyltransferase n=1 Tax=Brevundimonas sp. TaxID=1871086 RepID=UPI0026329551|nr:GNAT family N-acetyltransferase [Brevundimonas sp.]HRO33022.1 GNAT family N-acetyltransferase [Brevundimonas sp.]